MMSFAVLKWAENTTVFLISKLFLQPEKDLVSYK